MTGSGGSGRGRGGSWGTHTIWGGGGVATRNTGPYIHMYVHIPLTYRCKPFDVSDEYCERIKMLSQFDLE